MTAEELQKKNARYHIVEGALYISTGALLQAQTLMPALVKRLGGSDALVGTWPVAAYLAYFFPQIIWANYSRSLQYRKPTVLRRGFIQRLHILLLACIIVLWGASAPLLALALLFVVYISNQATAGSVAPLWMDFLVKTTSPEARGKLLGWRTSIGAALGLFNGLILTALLAILDFPYNYASIIGLAFLYQAGSLVAQNKVAEKTASAVADPVLLSDLLAHVRSIVTGDPIFRKFLVASALLTLSFSSAAFFTVAAIREFSLDESIVGIFTVVTIAAQILSGIFIGWIADARGAKSALLVCGLSLIVAIAIAWLAHSLFWFYPVFAFTGITVGAEMFMRYNFAVECAHEKDRPMYVGLMNAWFAPFYLAAPLAGWLSAAYGYRSVFVLSLVIGIVGIVLLARTPDPRRDKLALSSK
jgi:MFS family permease